MGRLYFSGKYNLRKVRRGDGHKGFKSLLDIFSGDFKTRLNTSAEIKLGRAQERFPDVI